MAKGSYFKNWSSLQQDTPVPYNRRQQVEVLFGQVLDVIYNSENPEDIGAIRVKIQKLESTKDDDQVINFAHPANRNMIKYPVEGEIVLLTIGPSDFQSNGSIAKRYYYTTVLASSAGLTYNGNPYFISKVGREESPLAFNSENEKRFEAKLKNNESFITDGYLEQRQALQPYEGDLILQGRFGSSIRLGSVGFGDKNQWSDNQKSATSGNAITSIVVNRSKGVGTKIEDINEDDSTVFMSGITVVPVKMQTSQLKSVGGVFNVLPGDLEYLDTDEAPFIEPKIVPPPRIIITGGTGNGGMGGTSQEGTPYTGAGAPGGCILPCDGAEITSNYYRASSGDLHGALDIVSSTRKLTIYAVADGVVTSTQWEHYSYTNSPCIDSAKLTKSTPEWNAARECGGGFGNFVVIYHPQLDIFSLYGHLVDLPLVKKGDKVTQGQQIGIMGNSGQSNGTHLHFELINPTTKNVANQPAANPAKHFSYGKPYKLDIVRSTPFYVVVNPDGPVGREKGLMAINTTTITGISTT